MQTKHKIRKKKVEDQNSGIFPEEQPQNTSGIKKESSTKGKKKSLGNYKDPSASEQGIKQPSLDVRSIKAVETGRKRLTGVSR